MKQTNSVRVTVLLVLAFAWWYEPVQAQIFENLRENLIGLGGVRYPVGDPSVTLTNWEGEVVRGPKDIAVADLDNDHRADFVVSDKDGSVTLYFGQGDGTFADARYLHAWIGAPLDDRAFYFTNYFTNVFCNYETSSVEQCTTIIYPPSPTGEPGRTNVVCFTNFQYECVGNITNVESWVSTVRGPVGLRGLAIADFSGDGWRDIAVASPGESRIYVFLNETGRAFADPQILPGWFGVRDLAAGDFDGDGLTDLAAGGTTNGVAQYRSLGGGQFTRIADLPSLGSGAVDLSDDLDFDFDFPQPAFYLKSVRHPGDDRDELIVSFAQRRKIWVLRAGLDGLLAVAGDVEDVSLTALDAAPLFSPTTNGAPVDLITAYSRGGCLDIFASANTSQRFEGSASRRYYVPGAPRNVRIADLDLDGWNDVVVVAQNSSRVFTYKNNQGELELAAEGWTGLSPREMDLADFNGDSRPDLAVLNRRSLDVSVLITATNLEGNVPIGFLTLDNVYPVDGGVSGLDLGDFNRDERLDVIQLHRDSGEFSVRLTQEDGSLGPPSFYSVTNAFQPAAQSLTDVNGDEQPDIVSANLSGSVTVRLGFPDGTFGEPRTYSLPADASGSLFALVPGDFDGDGHIDLAAGYLDCRVSFFRGDGLGGFTHAGTHLFIYEPRSMAAADLDQDGDLDLVGGSWMNRFVVVENEGSLLDVEDLLRTEYGNTSKSGAKLHVVDHNHDGDPDIVLGSESSFDLWLGSVGVTFFHVPVNAESYGSTFVLSDLDGDGTDEMVSICSTNTCLTIQVFTNGQYYTVLSVPVPFTSYLAAGDLDGDGFTDLVGSGEVLWVALSSRPAVQTAPTELLASRSISEVVINEVLAANSGVPVVIDGDRTTDWVELYHGGDQPVDLSGWQLRLIRINDPVPSTNVFVFPAGATMEPASHRLIIFSGNIRSPYHTGFNLPAEGAMLLLVDTNEQEKDRLQYPETGQDLSFARYTDGSRSFVVNRLPSPGAPNVDNGAVDPVLSLGDIDLEALRLPDRPLRFTAAARDDVGIVNVSVLWRRLDIPDDVTKRLILFDDGMNEDGAMNDGVFVGTMEEIFPPDAEIQFFVEATDLTDRVVTSPGNPRFAAPGRDFKAHTLAMRGPAAAIEISEIVADNETGLVDENGGHPDWVEIRNTSNETILLNGVGLSSRFFGNGERLSFDGWPSLGRGQHLVLYADSKPGQGILHAPFKLNRGGERVLLTGTTPNGARYLMDAVDYGAVRPDQALSRLGVGGPWVENIATPLAGNVSGSWLGVVLPDSFVLAYPTRPDRLYTVEYKDDLKDGSWTPLPSRVGSGLEQTVEQPLQAKRFFRIKEE